MAWANAPADEFGVTEGRIMVRLRDYAGVLLAKSRTVRALTAPLLTAQQFAADPV